VNFSKFKYVVIGAGFWGATIAERIASDLDEKVLVVEKRNHIGGNSYSEIDAETGVECHKYGSHIFHTSHKHVWEYINRFSEFNNYRHKVFSQYHGQIFQMPINLNTINAFYGKNLKPFEADAFLQAEIAKEGIIKAKNFEEKAISLIGRPLYEALIKGYTLKQWETDPKNLPACIITRLPVRKNYNNDYFDDPYQGIPMDGYDTVFSRMLGHKNIEVLLSTDYFDIKKFIPDSSLVVYTGPIDRFFNYKYGRLTWRSLRFEKEVHKVDDYQGTPVMNYADDNIPYTRIHEFKHYHPERRHKDVTVIYKEYSESALESDELYYPVNTDKDKQMLKRYEKESRSVKNVILGGRLGAYRYFDMDDAINGALYVYGKQIKNGKIL